MPDTTIGLATSFITFSRPGASGGGATTTDRDGKIKWAGHNLLLASESFDSSSWTKTGATISANSVVSPNGTTTADGLREIAGGTTHGMNQLVTGDGSIQHTISVFVKGVNRTWAYFGSSNSGGSAAVGAYFELTGAGSVGTTFAVNGTSVSRSITALSGGWYLITQTFTHAAGHTTNVGMQLYSASADNTVSFSGVTANGLDVWGAHLYRSDLGGMQLNPAQPAGMQSYYPTTPRNLLGYTEDFSNAAWGKLNIAAFGSGSIANAIIAPNGLQTADKIVASTATGYHQVTQSFIVGSGANTLTVYAKAAEYSLLHIAEGSGGRFQVSFNLATGTVVSGSSGPNLSSTNIVSVGDGWYRCVIVMTSVSAGIQIGIIGYPVGATLNLYGAQYTGDGTSGIYLWGAQLSDSASLDTYVPVYGAAVTSAAYYAPRLDFDPVTLAARGLLVEEARTNLFLHSNDFSQTAWSKVASTVTASSGTSPDGTNNAWRWLSDAGSTTHYLGQNYSQTSGVTYTVSAWVKSNTGSSQNFTLFASSVGVSANLSATTQWQRFTFSYTAASTISAIFGVNRDSSNNASNLLVYGLQLEVGSFATSYIPNGSAVAGATRAADVASVSTQAFPYSSSASSLVLSYTLFSDGGENILELSASASANGLLFATASGTNNVQTYVDASSVSLGATVLNAVTKLGIAYDGASNGTVRNGGAVSSVGTTVSAAANKLCFGSSFGGLYQMSGHIRQVTYIPRRISNAELQSRTA